MPITISFKSDGVIEKVAENMANASSWMPKIVETAFGVLGRSISILMELELGKHNYTGELAGSVEAEHTSQEVRIEPKAMRGKWDAGSLLEMGTRPHVAPFAPIARYADFVGAPAGAIWAGIAAHGTKAYPFLQPTLDRSGDALKNAAERIAILGAEAALSSIPKGDVVG